MKNFLFALLLTSLPSIQIFAQSSVLTERQFIRSDKSILLFPVKAPLDTFGLKSKRWFG
jgi:hypothetical protein